MLAFALLLSLQFAAVTFATTDPSFMPVGQLRSGMLGQGRTVFQGTRIDTFQVEILGVVHNSLGPRRDLILARLAGGPLAATGLVRGMSGSPVYVDGRLIGAVAYGWAFTKTPICGITPIQQMNQVLDRPLGASRPHGAGAPVHLDASTLELSDPGLQRLLAAKGGLSMQPLATPVWVAGIPAGAVNALRELLQPWGMQVLSGPGGKATDTPVPMVPGAALGVQLISGDMSVTAIGTATYVKDGRVLGFGHPLMLLGGTDLPLTAAHIYAIIPSLYSSFKLGVATGVVGALRQDRKSGIAGLLGQSPAMLPISVGVDAQDRHSTYRFGVAPHPDLIAGLARVVVLGVVQNSAKLVGDATVELATEVQLSGGQSISTEQVYSGPAALVRAALSAPSPLTAVLASKYASLRPAQVHFSLAIRENLSVAEVRALRVNPNPVHPGESLTVRVTVQPRGRDPQDLDVHLRIPPSLPPGPLTVRAGGGSAANRWDRARTPEAFNPRTARQLLRLLNTSYRNDVLFVELYRSAPGLTLDGRELPGLPPSARAVLKASASSGHLGPVQGRSVARTSRTSGYVLSGEQAVSLTVRRSDSRPATGDTP